MNSTGKPHRRAGRLNKRDLLLNAAIEVFAQKGSNSATIADVARKARVALGTVYIYFESKDDLLQRCMNEVISNEIDTIISKTAGIVDPMDRLYEFFMHHITLVNEKPYIARFITVEVRQSESFARRNPGYNPMQRYLDFVEKISQGAIDSGRIRPIDPKAFALLVVGAMDIIIWQWLASDSHMDIEAVSYQIRQILHSGVVNPQV
jgi:TetR/AcrR family fatty acid metabolism transcriptional regulator